MMNFFENVQQAPIDSIFGIQQSFIADARPKKVNLGVGVYRTSDLKPYVLAVVTKAEALLLEKKLSKEYLPIEGDREFTEQTKALIFGNAFPTESIFAAQTIGGTGALRIAAQFLFDYQYRQVYLSDPTWDNHYRIFSHAGMNVGRYPYYDRTQKTFDFQQMRRFLESVPTQSIVVLQSSCHNPTGYDLKKNEWIELLSLFKKKELLPFFDFAYQGFGDGLEEDTWAIRLFAKEGLQAIVAASYSKNFGLYAERVGALFILCHDEKEAMRVGSQIKVKIRGLYSNPPCHGARIVAAILNDASLFREWKNEVDAMRGRIQEMRESLYHELKSRIIHENSFEGIIQQKGMFSFTGLTAAQVAKITEIYGIYMPTDGRMNIAGLNHQNVFYVADALAEAANEGNR
jgi:aspartate/tyrosine/aromatic aminotransferase